MPKLNFEQRPATVSRDIGGPPGSVLLLVATALAFWMIGIVLRGGA